MGPILKVGRLSAVSSDGRPSTPASDSLSPRGTSGERAGERGGIFVAPASSGFFPKLHRSDLSVAPPFPQRFPKLRRSGTSKIYAAPTELDKNCVARGYKYVAPLELHGARKRAFTLIELLVLIATLAVMAALVLPMTVRPKY